jgi:D-alanyl-D-alanine carboxypeptidase
MRGFGWGRRLGVFVAGIGLVAGSAAPAVADRRPDPVASELQSALDDVVAAGASGVVLRLDDGPRTYRQASGQARLDPPLVMAPGAKLRVGSITKSFVSTVALQLVGEGRLRLSDPVERWLPGLVPNGEQITVQQLLNHTSGLFNYTEDEAWVTGLFTDPLKSYTPQQLVAVSNAHPPQFAPGTSWSYSNTNYIVVGLILQRVTHRPVSDLIEQRIIQPLHLRHTSFPDRSPDIAGYHAHGYYPPSITGDGYFDFTRVSPSWAWTAGALVSNTDDLRTFYRALLGGRLLRPAQLAAMKTLVPTENGFDYGLGLFRWDTPCGPVWGHDGSVPGYLSFAFSDESGRRGFTFGLPTQADQPIALAADRVLGLAICRTLGQPVAPTADTARSAGRWTPRVDRSVTIKPGVKVAGG